MKTIYYFSGTGNTLYLAKYLKEKCSYNLINLAAVTDTKVHLEGEVGFLFPVYAMGIPKAVEDFLKRVIPEKAEYIFAIATCGGSGYGIPFQQINSILEKKGKKLNYSEYCHMPDNYLKLFTPLSEEKAKADIEKSKSRMELIAENLSAKRNEGRSSNLFMYPVFFAIYRFWRHGLTRAYKSFQLDREKCIKCGICKAVCPVDNIDLVEEMPVWKDQCQDCLACANLCPAVAISCGRKSRHNLRYKNPYISTDELKNSTLRKK